jgi:hypothetical protein
MAARIPEGVPVSPDTVRRMSDDQMQKDYWIITQTHRVGLPHEGR